MSDEDKIRINRGILNDVSEIDFLDWNKMPGGDKIRGKIGVITIDGVKYEILDGVSKDKFKKIAVTNARIKRRVKSLFGEDFEISDQLIYSTKKAMALSKHEKPLGLYLQIGEVYDSPYYNPMSGKIVYSDAEVDSNFFETTLVHENVHHNLYSKKKDGSDRLFVQEIVAEMFTTMYSRKYNTRTFIGYPEFVSWMTSYAEREGYSLEKLQKDIVKAYKNDGLYSYINKATKPSGGSDANPSSLKKFFPGWEKDYSDYIEENKRRRGVVIETMGTVSTDVIITALAAFYFGNSFS